jgi:hypothetical protein
VSPSRFSLLNLGRIELSRRCRETDGWSWQGQSSHRSGSRAAAVAAMASIAARMLMVAVLFTEFPDTEGSEAIVSLNV